MAHIIKKYYTQAAEQEDLISIGTIGLIKAVDTFRPERKIRLATYASRCVENEVLMYFRSRKSCGRCLSDTIEPTPPGAPSASWTWWAATTPCSRIWPTGRSACASGSWWAAAFTDREAEVIRRRYGLSGRLPQTQRQVAAAFGISRSYVSRRAYCKHPERLGLMLKIVFCYKKRSTDKNSICPYFGYIKFPASLQYLSKYCLFCCQKGKIFQIFIQNFVFSYCILMYIVL